LPAEQYFAAQRSEPTSAGKALAALGMRLHDPEHPWTSPAIKAACLSLGEVPAVPTLLTLFAGGALELHHACLLHMVAAGKADEDDVQELLDDADDGLAARPPEEARAALGRRATHGARAYGAGPLTPLEGADHDTTGQGHERQPRRCAQVPGPRRRALGQEPARRSRCVGSRSSARSTAASSSATSP